MLHKAQKTRWVAECAILAVWCCVDGNVNVRMQPNSLTTKLEGICCCSSLARCSCAELSQPLLFLCRGEKQIEKAKYFFQPLESRKNIAKTIPKKPGHLRKYLITASLCLLMLFSHPSLFGGSSETADSASAAWLLFERWVNSLIRRTQFLLAALQHGWGKPKACRVQVPGQPCDPWCGAF